MLRRSVPWLVACLLAGSAAHANGVNTHAWIGLRAVEQLPEGSLKTLLTRPELHDVFANGCVFPDGGYAVKDDYGETAHWEPFVDGYVRWIRAHYQPPYSGDAAQHIAFLMGVAAHGMADQVFDSAYFKKGEREDAAGWSEELLDSFDTATDVFLVEQTGQRLKLEPWFPAELPEIFESGTGYVVPDGALDNGQFLIISAVLDYAQAAVDQPSRLTAYHARYPWAAAHLLDEHETGSPPIEARAVESYLLALWDRLHGLQLQENLVIATEPSDGAAGHEIDHTRLESQLIVIFGHRLDHASVTPERISVTDGAGQTHEVQIGYVWGSADASVVTLTPVADWPADSDLTVTLQPGLRSLDGLTLEAPLAFHFSTRSAQADDPVPGADPTPRVGEPAGSAAPPDSTPSGSTAQAGCSLATHGEPTALALLMLGLLVLGLASRRRRA